MTSLIVCVEDLHVQEEWIVPRLASAFPKARIENCRTEAEFRERLPTYRSVVPDLFIMDVMLRWTDASPTSPPMPPEVESGRYHRGGIRCARLVVQDALLGKVPLVFYTVVAKGDLDEDLKSLTGRITYVHKESGQSGLLKAVRSILNA